MSEIVETEAEQLGAAAVKDVETDLPTWEADLKSKVEQLVSTHPVIQHLIADLRRYGIPVPAVAGHFEATGQTLPAPTPDEPSEDAPVPAGAPAV